jgi:hypothetical protein
MKIRMKATKLLRNRAVAVAGGLTVLSLAAGGVAYATQPSSSPSSSAATVATSATVRHDLGLGRRPLLRLLRHTVHAQLIVGTKHGYETVILDRGTLESVSATSITIQRPDGPMVTESIGSSTRFRGLPESKLAKGDRVITAQINGIAAVVVGALPPKPAAGGTSSTA